MNKLTYERAKLLYTPYDVDQMRHLCALRDVEIDRLRADNAKLRELGGTMLRCIMANERKALICWECPAHKEFDELRSFCCIRHDAAELGIEVDG